MFRCLRLLLVVSSLAVVLVGGYGPYSSTNCADNRVAMVHLFEWKWNDIAAECERFLGPMGYCGIQVSPPTENVVIVAPEPMRPWWERYQPVSYRLETRSGTEREFEAMVGRCNAARVRIYVDGIINHMAGLGRSGTGTNGTYFLSDVDDADFPGVPYTGADFHDCTNCGGCCCINQWTDHTMVRECPLVGLIDLDQKNAHVQDMLVEYMNRVIGYGVAGFRIDAGKHVWPDDMEVIWGQLDDLRSDVFGSGVRPFFYPEVIDMNQNGEVRAQEYVHLGKVSEFRYCTKIANTVGALWDIPNLYDPGWGMVNPEDAFVFVDNHDNQRGHGSGGSVITHKDPRNYKMAQAITLSQSYGQPQVMSSFYFNNSDQGPPANEDWTTKDVVINADGSCGNGWVCEHRWPAIAGMAGFAKAANGQPMTNWWSEGNKAAYARGNRAFVVLTNEGTLDRTFFTGLPPGDYCNVIEGCPTPTGCTGKTFTVDSTGNARIIVDDANEPMAAIHVEAMAGTSTGCIDTSPVDPTTTPPPSSTTTLAPTTTRDPTDPMLQRTVVFFFVETVPGQDVFIRGGISHFQRPGCTEDAETSACAVYISTNSLGDTPHYDKYNSWRYGNSKLNWYGAQAGQGTYQGTPAEGTPMAWTTNKGGDPGYQPDNEWGDHYWKLDMLMDCSQTENGWFEFKGYVTNRGWESDVIQVTCTGSVGGTNPYSGPNHFGRCGYQNVFSFGANNCQINTL